MKLKAYSLLEISIVLTITGITIGMLFPLFYLVQNQYHKNNNANKQEHVRIKMQNYLLKFGYLPYAGNENGEEVEGLLHGYVPYKALDLRYENTLNHKKKKFKYYVNKKFIKPESDVVLLPIHYPTAVVYKKNMKTFSRCYNYQNNELHYDLNGQYDSIIILDEANSNVIQNSCFYACEPIKIDSKYTNHLQSYHKYNLYSEIDHLNAAYMMIKKLSTDKNEKYIVYNSVAWIVTTDEPQLINDQFVFKYNNNILYQTKFDMLAQCGYPCTNEHVIIN